MNNELTIRELVKERQKEVRNKDLQWERAAEILDELSSLLGNINDEIRQRDVAYNVTLLGFLNSEEKANRAKIKAECSKEYLDKREARDTKEVCLEMIRSLKYYIRAKGDENQQGRNMT